MPNAESNNADHPVTKAEMQELLAATTDEFKKSFATKDDLKSFATKDDLHKLKEETEQLLADQANVILEAMNEQLEEKLDEKFDPVITKLDSIIGSIDALKQENTVGAEQLRRHGVFLLQCIN